MTPTSASPKIKRSLLRRTPIYAIIEAGGKQLKVAPGDVVDVEKMPAQEGSTVELERVLLVAEGEVVTVGRPTIPGARVLASVVAHGRGEKVVVFKFKPKTRYHKKTGHRQPYTRLQVSEIRLGG